MEIRHFSHHQHPLVVFGSEMVAVVNCAACRKDISPNKGPSYGCLKCQYFLHQSCADLPREMIHPLHPQHPLSLHARSPTFNGVFDCHVCGEEGDGFVLRCSQCRFQLDACCGSLTKKNSHSHGQPQLNTNAQHIGGHNHPLILCSRKETDFTLSCSACKLPMEGSIYVCLQCNLMLHKWCVELPPEIDHPFHPLHPLTLLLRAPYLETFVCDSCGEKRKGSTYYCFRCQFYLDVCCASLLPMPAHNCEPQEHPILLCSRAYPTRSLRDKDFDFIPLILCDKGENFDFSCSGCALPIKDSSIFASLECRLLLHESCSKFPTQIIHPFHPKHPLVLVDASSRVTSNGYGCGACSNPSTRLGYHCHECLLTIDTKCAFRWSTAKYEFHQHPLVFFNVTSGSLDCKECNLPIRSPFLRCAECDLSLHVHCIPALPPTITHPCHIHPLTFTISPIKHFPDYDEYFEYYCNACENIRLLADPTYHCEKCPYVAHIHCVMSEIQTMMEKESSSACKHEDTKLDTSDAVKEKSDEGVTRALPAPEEESYVARQVTEAGFVHSDSEGSKAFEDEEEEGDSWHCQDLEEEDADQENV